MSPRLRKLIGTVVIIPFVIGYAALAMALADSRISQAPEAVRALAYALLGLAWVIPLLPLIRWMERPEAGR
jgi:predicted membrane channel-forming protein YqfA (hemolysin III family)